MAKALLVSRLAPSNDLAALTTEPAQAILHQLRGCRKVILRRDVVPLKTDAERCGEIGIAMRSTRCYFSVMSADVVRLTVLKRMLNKVREFLNKATKGAEVRYLSVPLWKPWRDF
jgi:hypothetical protein